MDWFPYLAYGLMIVAGFVFARLITRPRPPAAHRGPSSPRRLAALAAFNLQRPDPDPETSPIAISPSSTKTLPVYRGVPL